MTFLNQGRVSGFIVPAAASGSVPVKMMTATCLNSSRTAWNAAATRAIMPSTSKMAVAPGPTTPPKAISLANRAENWPPVAADSTAVL